MKRKLLWFTVGFAFVLLCMQCEIKALTISLVCTIVGAAVWIITKHIRNILPFLMGILIAVGWFSLYQTIWPQNEFIGAETKVTAVAVASEYARPAKSGNGVWCRSVITSIDGQKPKGRTVLSLYLSDVNVVVRPGDTITFSGKLLPYENTEDFMAFTYYKTRYIDGMSFCESFQILPAEKIKLRYLPVVLSQKIKEKIGELFGEHSGLLQALLIGDQSLLTTKQTEELRVVGLSHVVAVSGMHVSFLVYFIVLILGKRKAPWLALPVLLCFAMMIGPVPSVLRAVFMQIVFLIAPMIKRETDGVTSLAGALLLILLANPYAVLDVGLQLSFAATLGLILYCYQFNGILMRYVQVKNRMLYRLVRIPVTTLSASLCSLLFTTPITMHAFGMVSVIAPLANVLLLWSISIIFSLGLASVLIGFAVPVLGSLIAYPVTMLVKLFFAVAHWLSLVPFASIRADEPSLIALLVIVYVLIFVLYYLKPRPSHQRIIRWVGVGLIGLCVVSFALQFISRPKVSASVLDVGQGLAVLVETQGETVLVDCGSSNNNAAQVVYNKLMEHYDKTIDALVLTHLDHDHIDGIAELMERIRVKKLFMYQPLVEEKQAREIIKNSEETGTEVVLVSSEQTLDFKLIEVKLLPVAKGKDMGLSVLVTHQENDLLITGDVDQKGESYLLSTYSLPDIEFYVVGHHGSKTSTSVNLLEKTKPEIAIISVGARNSYGHPTKEVLERLKEASVSIRRTDLDGTVSVKF